MNRSRHMGSLAQVDECGRHAALVHFVAQVGAEEMRALRHALALAQRRTA